MQASSQFVEYGIVDVTERLTVGAGSKIPKAAFVPIFTSRDVTNFNYHVSTDNEAGFDVYFVPDLDTSTESYPGCFAEDVMSTGTLSCNNVEMGSGLLVTIPFESATEQTLTDITVKLQ